VRLCRLLSLLALSLSLVGCWSRIEINDLAIVGLIGIDRSEDGDIELWINVNVPSRLGGAPGTAPAQGSSGSPVVTLSARGQTVVQAANRIQTQLPRRLFWAHARVILIGERLARENSRAAVDFLTRHRELRLNNYVLVVPDKPQDVMGRMVDIERLPSDYIREIERSRIVPVSTVQTWVQQLASPGADPYLAVADSVDPPPGAPDGQRSGIEVNRAALFQRDRLVHYADFETSQGLMWLAGQPHHGVVTVTVPGVSGAISVVWLYSHTDRRVRVENGRVAVYVHVRIEGDVAEQQAALDLSDAGQLRRVEAQMAGAVKARMMQAVKLMKELKVDSAGIGEEIHRQQPAMWYRLHKDWQEEAFPSTKIVVSVDARVRRTGLTSRPQGIRENEFIEERK